MENNIHRPTAPARRGWRTTPSPARPSCRSCSPPVRGPERNGLAEAFVKTFKRDYVRVNYLLEAKSVLQLPSFSMGGSRTASPIIRTGRLGTRSPREWTCPGFVEG